MALWISSIVIFLLIVTLGHTFHLKDLAGFTKSLSTKHHRHHKRHNHNHQEHQSLPTADNTDRGDDAPGDEAKPHQDGGDAEVFRGKTVTEALLPEGWSTPAAFPVFTAESGSPHDDQLADQRPDGEHQSPDPPEQKLHNPPQQPNAGKLQSDPSDISDKNSRQQTESDKIVSRTEMLSQDDRTTKVIQKTEPADTPNQGDEVSEYASPSRRTSSKRKPVDLSVRFPKDKREMNYSVAAIDPRNEKFLNRPRWQRFRENEETNDRNREAGRQSKHHFQKSKAASKTNRRASKGSSDKPRSAISSKRGWSHNRPRWDISRKTYFDKGTESSRKQDKAAHAKLEKKKHLAKSGSVAKKKEGVQRKRIPQRDLWQKWSSRKQKKTVAKGCPGCSKTEVGIAEARELHKQVLKRQLLDKLRLEPIFNNRPLPPKLPEQVFPNPPQSDHAGYDDQYYAKPTQLLIFGRDLGPRHRLKKPRTGTYQFGVTDKVKSGVTSARLWVYKMKDASDVHGQTFVVTELNFDRRGRLRERSQVARLDTHVQEGWLNFDVTRLVQRWMDDGTPASLQMLAIRCKTCHRTNYRAIFGIKSNFRPVLVIGADRQTDGQRDKRTTCDPNTGCCKFDLTVHFEDLGIYEILRPRSIKADYCYGTCESPTMYHYNHTMVRQHMRYNSQFDNSTMRDRLKPCCVPVVLREASVLHYINEGLDTQVSLVPNLLVERCGCA